jgi:hypothetical protein
MMAEQANSPAQTDAQPEWELQVSSRWLARWGIIFAVVIVATFSVTALLLRAEESGVYFRAVDQVAVVLIGLVLSTGPLLLTRPRLRAGKSGVSVRSIVGEKLIGWDEVVRLTFPKGGSWARVDLPDYEYVPVLAVHARDGESAALAVEKFREIEARYRPS